VVGFGGVETWDGNDSYGGGNDDDDGGAGFDFGGDGDDDHDPNEFLVPELNDVRKIQKIKIGYAKIARKVDVKRLKRDLWMELEQTFALSTQKNNNDNDDEDQGNEDALSTASTVSDPDLDLVDPSGDNKDVDHAAAKVASSVTASTKTTLSFQDTVRDMQTNQSQSDVTLPFYFICILHLCNEKELALESTGLDDFIIHRSLDEMHQHGNDDDNNDE